MVDPVFQPVAIELDRLRELRVTWADGRTSVCPLPLLRRECPCAGCREKRHVPARPAETGRSLQVIAPAADEERLVTAESVELVGHYALRLVWRDGHNAGIFEYRLLRDLCPPPEPRAETRRELETC